MKYVIMFTSTPELDAAVPPERAQAGLRADLRVVRRARREDHRLRCRAAARHHGDDRAPRRAAPVVADGPFSEAKEVIGGFSVIDVADLDAAIDAGQDLAPLELPGVAVEIRPMVVDYSQFEQ